MARRQRRQQQGDFRGYVEHRMDDAEKVAYKKWLTDTEAVDSAIVKTVEADYRLTVAYDDYNGAYQCSVTTKDDEHVNHGYVLVGRGSTWYAALTQAVYKHFVIMRGEWKDFARQNRVDWD